MITPYILSYLLSTVYSSPSRVSSDSGDGGHCLCHRADDSNWFHWRWRLWLLLLWWLLLLLLAGAGRRCWRRHLWWTGYWSWAAWRCIKYGEVKCAKGINLIGEILDYLPLLLNNVQFQRIKMFLGFPYFKEQNKDVFIDNFRCHDQDKNN